MYSYDEMRCFLVMSFYISSVCFERTETPKEVYCISSCYRSTFSTVHTLQCGLDLQGKQMKRKRKLQAEGGEDDLAVGEMSFIMVVWSSVNVTKT